MAQPGRIVILTGAGVSAESGLATFRGPDGLWEGHRVEDICTPEALARDRGLVLDFYDQRRRALAGVAPNAAHHALARLDREWKDALWAKYSTGSPRRLRQSIEIYSIVKRAWVLWRRQGVN